MKEEPLSLLNSTICTIQGDTKRIVAVIRMDEGVPGMVLYGTPTTGDNSSLRAIMDAGHKVLGSSAEINDDIYWHQREEFIVVTRMTPLEHSLHKACDKIKEEIGL